ncbi:DUF5082 domain-containing protein [Bacillus sp. FJAT-42376]|uniref:YwqH-like family protein n=1 Tax=Bacillus sp. FJAT-42376 TaxID=2014076 RepID=UPI000F4F13D0|nr:DUF5082 family protein [Bacillus sp. FJAT-42376]AZB44612.1 DUF5082 domain-containing protein [Bacillus sp. FJAT-42376]
MSAYLSYLYEQLRKKEEELEKLEAAKPKLEGIQQEFKAKITMCKDPELTADTFKGEHATDFDKIRTELKEEYKDLFDGQLEDVLNQIERRIEEIKEEIKSLKEQIAAEEARLAAEAKAAADAAAKAN